MLEYYVTVYVARTLQKCHQERVKSSKSSAFFGGSDMGVSHQIAVQAPRDGNGAGPIVAVDMNILKTQFMNFCV
uniref:Uncharacterized protein n=1 Tax=Solanum tuberosum TaxID=4113 RepID=M1DPZ1_SOLTU